MSSWQHSKEQAHHSQAGAGIHCKCRRPEQSLITSAGLLWNLATGAFETLLEKAAPDQKKATAPSVTEVSLTDWQQWPCGRKGLHLGYAARRHRSWVEEVEDIPQGGPQGALHNAFGVGEGVLRGLGVQL